MINILIYFTYSISYDGVKKVKMFFTEMQLNEQNQQSLVPNNIQLSTFITFVCDNCDQNTKTISEISQFY